MERLLIALTFIMFINLTGCVQSDVTFDMKSDVVKSDIYAETAADGKGSLIENYSLYTRGESIQVFAIERDELGQFIKNKEVQWSLDGTSGTLSVNTGGKSANFVPAASGQSKVTIEFNDKRRDVIFNVVDNIAPSMSFSTPTNTQDILRGNSFDLNFSVTDPDDNAEVKVYISNSNVGNCSEQTEITNFNSDDGISTFSYDTNNSVAGSYYFCATLTDIVGTEVIWSDYSLAIVENAAPTLSFSTPSNGEQVWIGNNFDLNFSVSDSDDDASLSLYYANSNSGNCSDGTLLTTLSEDLNPSTYSLDTTGFSAGTYYFCGVVLDAYHTIEVWSTDSLSLADNTVPTLSFSTPSNGEQVWIGNNFDLNFSVTDPDDDATLSLYYANSNAGNCSDGVLLTTLSEDSNPTSYSLDTTGLSAGTYYFCGTVTDAVRTVEVWSAQALSLADNTAPTLSFSTPSNGQQLYIGQTFDLDFSATDPDDNAVINFYYSTNSSGTCSDQNFVTTFNEDDGNTTYVFDTSVLSDGDYYFCATMTDAVRTITFWSTYSLSAVTNIAPSLSFSTPTASSRILLGSTFDLEWSASDPDDNAVINFYYSTSSSGTCSAQNFVTTFNEDDGNTSYTYDTSGFGVGNYYFCATITDTMGEVEVWNTNALSIETNTAPTISITSNTSASNHTKGEILTFTWTDSDPDDDATINFYYMTANSGDCAADGALITSVSEDDGTNSYDWTPNMAASGDHWICAEIDDGVNSIVQDFSAKITMLGICNWLGVTTSTSSASNWENCGGGVPTQYDYIAFPNTSVSEPTVDATLDLFGVTTSSHTPTITVSANKQFRVYGDYAFKSSVIIKGVTADCSNCYLNLKKTPVYVSDNATLRLEAGATFYTGWITINFGDGVTAGHLEIAGGVSESEWIQSYVQNTAYGITTMTFNGTATNKSTVSIDGFYFKTRPPNNYTYGLYFKDHYEILKLDNIKVYSQRQTRSLGNAMRFENCSNGVFTENTFNNIKFENPYVKFASYNVYMDDTCTTIPLVGSLVFSGASGVGYGSPLEYDPNSLVDWSVSDTAYHCEWNGSTSTDWFNPLNWDNCANGRGGYPSIYDDVFLQSGTTYEPYLSESIAVKSFSAPAADLGGATITLGENVILWSLSTDITTNIGVQGITDDCSTCIFGSTSMSILGDAILTMKRGVMFKLEDGNPLLVGDGVTPGHLVLDAGGSSNKTYWPNFLAWSYYTGKIEIQGVDAVDKSTLYIDGYFTNMMQGSHTVHLVDHYEVKNLDNMHIENAFTFSHGSTMASTRLKIENCANATFTDTSWDGIDFVTTPPADFDTLGYYNVQFENCGTQAPSSIGISQYSGGYNNGYGAGFSDDIGAILSWAP